MIMGTTRHLYTNTTSTYTYTYTHMCVRGRGHKLIKFGAHTLLY